MRIPTKLAVAMHEAGHAVVKLATAGSSSIYGIELHGEASEGTLGRVLTQTAWCPWLDYNDADGSPQIEVARSLAWQDMLFFLAGPIAELRWKRHSRTSLLFAAQEMSARCLGSPDVTRGSDLHQVRVRLNKLYAGEETTAFVRAWLAAEELVARHMNAIHWLARDLLDCEELSGAEVDAFWASFKRDDAAETIS